MASSNTREVEEVVDVLGGAKVVGRSVRSPEDLADRVRKGLPFAALSAVMEEYGISRDVVCDILQLSSRNFLRRKEQKRLSAGRVRSALPAGSRARSREPRVRGSGRVGRMDPDAQYGAG